MFAGILAIQLPQVQTFVADKVMTNVAEKLDGEIVFEKLHFRPFTTLVIKNVAIIDKNPRTNPNDSTGLVIDTLFNARYIIAKFTFEGLLKDECLHLDKAYISDARMNLVLENKPDDGDGDITTENISRIFRIKKPEEPRRSEKEIFHIRQVDIDNMDFIMKNHKIDEIPYRGGINWNDLEIKGININASDLHFKAGIMSGTMESLDFSEKSGWVCESITGKAEVGRGKTIIHDLHIKDRWSDINMPLFMMSYKNSKEFKYFTDRVRIDSEIRNTELDFKTLWYFAPQLYDNNLKASLSGVVGGFISDIDLDKMRVAVKGSGFSGDLSGNIAGLPDIEHTHLDIRLDNFLLNTEGLSEFIGEWSSGTDKSSLDNLAKGILFSMKGGASGYMNNLDINARVSSMIGRAEADIRMKNLLSERNPIDISGSLNTQDLDIGRIINRSFIGQTTLHTGFAASLGKNGSPAEVVMDSLIVDRLNLNGYDYTSIAAAGELSEESFDGRVICNDPNLNFMFQGTFALSAKTNNSLYRFYANLGHADLNAINIDKRGTSKVRLRAQADFTSTHSGEVIGKMDIGDVILENSDGRHEVGNINISSHTNDSNHSMNLKSGFATASYSGTSPLSSFIMDVLDISARKEIPALFKDSTFIWGNDIYDFNLTCHDMRSVLAFALPGMYMESGTSLNVKVSEEGLLDARLNSGRIAYKRNYLKGISATFNNIQDSFNAELRCDELMASSIRLSDNSLQAHADDNHIGIGFSYDNHSALENKGEFIINSDLSREDETIALSMDIKPSSIYMNSKEWEILPSNLTLKGKEMTVNSFGLVSGEEFIGINGSTSELAADTLDLQLQRFDISLLNSIIGDEFGIKGAMTGNVKLTSPLPNKGVLIDMVCDSTHFAGIPLGIVSIGSRLNDEKGGFDIALINEIEGRNSIALNGNLALKHKLLDAHINLDRLSIGYVQPFMTEIFSEMDGYMSGGFDISGNFNNLDIASEGARLEDARLKVAYTNVPYTANGGFHLDRNGVYFDDIVITDRFDGTGTVEGGITWNNFKDFRFDTHLRVNEIEGINLTEDMRDDFYGNIFATGNVSITGPLKSMVLSVDATTAKNGQIHIPMSEATAGGRGTNLLKFTEEDKEIFVDPYEEMISEIDKKEDSQNEFQVKIKVNAQPEVEAFVEIDKASGNVLSGRGNGVIELAIGNDMFDINGDYTLTGGNYKFVAIGLVSRDFVIQDGSSVRFNGDILESTLDIDALYKTKASLSTLIADTTSVANRRTVECGINITDKISNPRLSFSIEIPDLDPTVKSRVESALSTDDKVQKQFLSLLLSNSFLPDEQSGIVNNTTLLYSNVTEAMANQLNNIFHKLDIPLDLGLNYQPNEKGNDIFDVAVSTQLFNNRVVVNGSVGNKQYNSGGAQDVVGDLDIEIKLDRSGSFRLNLFSHSADTYTNYLDNSQRNGVGLTYQTEFNSLGQFFRNMFMSKSKRKAAKQAEEQAMREGGEVEMKVEAPDKRKKNERRKR